MLIGSRQLRNLPLVEIKRRLAFLRIAARDELPEPINCARYGFHFEVGVFRSPR
jgi:hypothetical protein